MKLGVIGAGAWGTALAITAARAGSEVILWSRNKDVADDINNNHLNSKYLGQIPIHKNIKATCDIESVQICDAILLVVPAQILRAVCQSFSYLDLEKWRESQRIKSSIPSIDGVLSASENMDGVLDVVYNELSNDELSLIADSPAPNVNKEIKKDTPIIICAKGVEQSSLALMSDIVAEFFPKNPIAVLSGPNFADEVASGLPACATLACTDKAAADKIISMMGNKLFRLYYSDDVVGAQIGGAVKNVIAIASGIAIGRGLGENARAALITRGIAEIGRLCTQMGGRNETLMGLSGIGDIMLTCASEKSRNMSLGIEIGKGRNLTETLKTGKTVEGVATSKSVSMLADKLGIEMPITNAVHAILHKNSSIESTINSLLERPFAAEGN